MKEVAAEETEAITSLKSASERQKNISKKLKRLKDGLNDQVARIPSYETRKIMINYPGRLKRKVRKMIENIEKNLLPVILAKDNRNIKKSLKNLKKAAADLNKNIPHQKVLHETSEEKNGSSGKTFRSS